MRLMGLVGTVFVLLCMVACSGKDKKDDKKPGKDGNGTAKPQSNADKIVGKWKKIKGGGDVGFLEFASDGKVTAGKGENDKRAVSLTYKGRGGQTHVHRQEGRQGRSADAKDQVPQRHDPYPGGRGRRDRTGANEGGARLGGAGPARVAASPELATGRSVPQQMPEGGCGARRGRGVSRPATRQVVGRIVTVLTA